MLSTQILSVSGPTLIAVEGAAALLFVHRRLSGVPYALAWAVAFVAFALHFVIAGSPAAVAGLMGLLLFVEGFRIRARGSWPSTGRLLAGGAAAAAAALLFRSGLIEIMLPGTIGLLLVYAISQVVPRQRRATPAEIAVMAMLGAAAALELGLATMALLDLAPALRLWLTGASVLPLLAAGGLFAMLLIASDFAGELRRTLHTDPLTGVLNRAGFEAAARETLERAEAWTQTVSIAIADIDRFKAINDRHGHAIGDATLACVAGHLSNVAGGDDLVGRIGGEEFAMLLWGADATAAHRRIDPLRKSLPGRCIEIHDELEVTVSIGIAERAGAEALVPMLDRADRALYRSKREGRDRTTLAPMMA